LFHDGPHGTPLIDAPRRMLAARTRKSCTAPARHTPITIHPFDAQAGAPTPT